MAQNALIEKELGALPSIDEMEVVDILVANGIVKKTVKFLAPSRTKGSKTPDLRIDGKFWEVKSLEKLGKYTAGRAGKAGLEQAPNLVFDLRKLSIVLATKATAQLEKEYQRTKAWNSLIIITRPDDKCLTFCK